MGGGPFLPVSDMFHTENRSSRTLIMSETTSGSVGYWCRFDLEGNDNIHGIDQAVVSLIGKY